MSQEFSHLSSTGQPQMVSVSGKAVTLRVARAQAKVWLTPAVAAKFDGTELISKKGPVFQTAIIAGIMAAKKTSELIPFCHPLALEDCQIQISLQQEYAVIESRVQVTSRTGVEMEALTAATVAALTIYDMCKALSHDLRVEEVRLLEKTGGKEDYHAK
jgi:cyclic pyranopterin phosphate synthase